MKLSERKRQKVYAGIHEAIVRARIDIGRGADFDYRFAQTADDAYEQVMKALRAEKPAERRKE